MECDSDGDGFAVFNLATISQQIYNNSGQTPINWNITYHETEMDAEAMELVERRALARLAIPDPYA